MEECLSIFNFKATEKRIGLFIDKKAFNELPREIYTDGIRLKQIIINLVSNAIKYTERGFVKLSGYTDRGAQMLAIVV